jgi:two-component system nitrogen regulation sensor histidine kinase GlnL
MDPAVEMPAALSAALKGLAHEVRNPLAGLQGAAQLLGRRLLDPDERRYLEVITAESARLSALVERLLLPQAPRPFTAVNVHEVLERVRVLAEADAGWAIVVQRDYDPSLPELAGDTDRLVQAIWNLVRNALESGSSEIRLRTRAEREIAIGDQPVKLAVRVDVIDNGRGVPEDLGARIFLPLVSGRADGSGLGLPLAQGVAREHHGALSYRSRPGHTVFTLLLPVET